MKPSSRTKPRALRAPSPGGHIRRNRAVWDRTSAGYDRQHRRALGGRNATSWGVFRLPERELRLLGPVRGKRILELGCGAARWSIALARRAGRPTGIDLSSAQLARAHELQRHAHVLFPLVRGSAERLPFRAESFDTIFCDWGAMTFSDPTRSLPEAARVLRPGGRFVFATASPWRQVTYDARKDRQAGRLVRPYFGRSRVEFPGDSAVEFHPPYGIWVDLFRASGLRVEKLIESRPRPRQRTTYLSQKDIAWARSWPIEAIWKLVKE